MAGVAFPEYFVSLPFALFMDSTLYVSFPGFVFLPCDHGLDFDISCGVTILNAIKYTVICWWYDTACKMEEVLHTSNWN